MGYISLSLLIGLIVSSTLALGCLIMLFSLCFRKSKCIRRMDFFGIMVVELQAAFISLLQICILRVTFYIFVLLVLLDVVLAVIYLRKVSKMKKENVKPKGE